ncbi:MAG: hypothetical protein P8X96_09395 [Desulfobacteraceae bacterium]
MTSPSVTIWNRLEARPRTREIDRALRCEIHDALWMLTRQWQFGEFIGEDAGSLICARAKYRTAYLDKLALGRNLPEDYDHSLPMEANVKKEMPELDLHLRMEMGRHWLRILRRHLAPERAEAVIAEFKADKRLQFRPPRDRELEEQYDNAAFICNDDYYALYHTVAGGRMLDGGFLYLHLTRDVDNFASDFLSKRDDSVDSLGEKFVEWFDRVHGLYGNKKSAWHPSHLEYQFDCTTPSSGDRSRVLRAEEYHGGRLEWYSFDYAGSGDTVQPALTAENPAGQMQSFTRTLLPSQAAYPGMPGARFWEMEDGRVDFGNIQTAATDTAKMIFAQFGLVYGNDWLTFPLELPLSCIAQITELTVTDVFGQQTVIPHVHARKRDEFWGFFQLHDRSFDTGRQNDSWLLLAPVVSHPMEGKPIEKAVFIRDEMANMVWAVENTIPDRLGNGMDGYEFAQKVNAFINSLIPKDQAKDPIENAAELKYVLASTVPDNWIPFIPVKQQPAQPDSRDIRLQRAAMPRVTPGFETRRIRPRTAILRQGDFKAPYYVYEEEVPRSGAVVDLAWNRARWHDGRIITWLGRKKTNGRGEKSSGLRFDFLEDK